MNVPVRSTHAKMLIVLILLEASFAIAHLVIGIVVKQYVKVSIESEFLFYTGTAYFVLPELWAIVLCSWCFHVVKVETVWWMIMIYGGLFWRLWVEQRNELHWDHNNPLVICQATEHISLIFGPLERVGRRNRSPCYIGPDNHDITAAQSCFLPVF